MAVSIKEISGKKALKEYIKFSIRLYKDSPYFVPPLIGEEVCTLSSKVNPAFDFCEAVYYMAYREGKPVGRIAGIINRKANEKNGEKYARFGFVDFIDDEEVCRELFNAVENWARSKGMTAIQGPLGFTDMDPEGMLIEGFDQVGTMATIYNYPYYPEHIAKLGYEKEIDWVEFKIYIPDAIPEKHQRISDIVRKKYNLKILKFSKTKDRQKNIQFDK